MLDSTGIISGTVQTWQNALGDSTKNMVNNLVASYYPRAQFIGGTQRIMSTSEFELFNGGMTFMPTSAYTKMVLVRFTHFNQAGSLLNQGTNTLFWRSYPGSPLVQAYHSTTSTAATSTTSLLAMKWYAIFVTFDGTNLKLYQSKTLVASGTGAVVSGDTGLKFNTYQNIAGDSNTASWLEVGIWPVALTLLEVQNESARLESVYGLTLN